MRMLVKAHGADVTHFDRPLPMREIETLLGTDALTVILLKDREHVLIMDDWAATKELPVSVIGTQFYWEKCGGQVDWYIRGDVFICPDSDANI